MPDPVAVKEAPQRPVELRRLVSEVERVFHGKGDVVRHAAAALLARGHILFEDVPGVGKTTLAHALAGSLGLSFQRVQFTSDLLPSDVLGVSVFDPRTSEFEVRPGPIFTNILVADEINRAPPRTQSGLLEAMQEGQVTIDDQTMALPRPFLVMATQNPLEHHGTYPLPESQMDRFLMRLTIGYPSREAERQILEESREFTSVESRVKPVLTVREIEELQGAVDGIHADPTVVDYLMSIVRATRSDPRIRLGVSPRGAVGLFRAARARALIEGRDYLIPDDVRSLSVPCLAHRVIPQGTTAATTEAHEESAALVEDIADSIDVPL